MLAHFFVYDVLTLNTYPQKAILDKSDNRKWFGVSIDEFMNTLNEYLYWYNGKRIKISLGAKSPLEYRRSLDPAA